MVNSSNHVFVSSWLPSRWRSAVKPPRRDRVRPLAQIYAAGRLHRSALRIGDPPRRSWWSPDLRRARRSFPNCSADCRDCWAWTPPGGPPVNRRRGDRRHTVDVAAGRRARMDGRARTPRSTRAMSFARRRVAGHAVTVIASAGESGRALRHVPFSSPDSDAAAARTPRHRRAPAARAPAAQSLGQPRRHASSAATPASRCGGPTASTRASSDYARANASIGINGTVINSVNANPQSLTAPLPRQGGGHRRRASGPTASASTWPPTSPRPRCSAA